MRPIGVRYRPGKGGCAGEAAIADAYRGSVTAGRIEAERAGDQSTGGVEAQSRRQTRAIPSQRVAVGVTANDLQRNGVAFGVALVARTTDDRCAVGVCYRPGERSAGREAAIADAHCGSVTAGRIEAECAGDQSAGSVEAQPRR